MKTENIYNLKGLSKVYSFTLRQTLKNKTYLFSLLIVVMVFALKTPLTYVMSKGQMKQSVTSEEKRFDKLELKTLYIQNDTAVTLESFKLGNAVIKYVDPSENFELPGEKDIFIRIIREADGYKLNSIISDSSKLGIEDVSLVTETVEKLFDEARMKESRISEKDIQRIKGVIGHEGVVSEDDYIHESSNMISTKRFYSPLMSFAIIIFMVVTFSASFIVASVTEEKQSKLVESLLVSVRPMALLMGKILAMLTYVLIMLGGGLAASTASELVLKYVVKADMTNISGQIIDFSIFGQAGIVAIITVIISLFIGFFSFAVFAGIFGSACTRTEDVQNATSSVMMISMVGYIASIWLASMDKSNINQLISLIPPFSYFTLPVMYAAGRIDIKVVILSYLIQAVVLVLLCIISVKTYRKLLLNGSSAPKFSDVFRSVRA